ncbi:GMC family oxidoreductase N-terminal domain-containing protein [Parendozoicomonas sp. Alg238-R29]|uniref:GMC family oxidoreductase N-terminal domain-containing protein n=1 Tax=Parendozoicomonas sp. Alg238-R29 TaxID=2993446 RepID=UPI0032B24878
MRHGNPLFTPRGKTLGGSSAVNGMVYIRGHKSDYDNWELQGNAGWGWDNALAYFRKSDTHFPQGNSLSMAQSICSQAVFLGAFFEG